MRDAESNHVEARKTEGVPTFVLNNVERIGRHQSPPGEDDYIEKAAHHEL